MLQIVIPSSERWDESREEFVYGKEQRIQLEHSLVSISKWESKWHKAFLGKKEKTEQEVLDYIRCMTVTPKVDPSVYQRLSHSNINAVTDYINDQISATYINSPDDESIGSETITSELIYYWMISFRIPAEFEKWHLNRLLKLIKICQIKTVPAKKLSPRAILERNIALNEKRKKELNTKG